jgi:predicted nuclease of restriction endonuclease-like (RecB) superfamily
VEDKITVDIVLRDPYLLPFLGLSDDSEKDLEDAILREMESLSPKDRVARWAFFY